MRFDFSSARLQLVVVRDRLATALVALLLIVVVGGHWFCLQFVAWVGMFAKFSQTCTFTEALVKTFNGKYLIELIHEGSPGGPRFYRVRGTPVTPP